MNRKKISAIIGIFTLSIFLMLMKRCSVNLITGRVSFPKKTIGTIYKLDSTQYTAFRVLKVSNREEDISKQSVFRVRFKFDGLEAGTNMRLSIIPAPFLMNMKNFRRKIWTINRETGEFQGIYQWSTEEAAREYPGSFVFLLMTKRAQKDTVRYEVLPNTDIDEYMNRKKM